MSKAISYYDWRLSFKRKVIPYEKDISNCNTLGIDEDNFKEFLSNWKEKNLN
jgi:hypothetical protein